MPAEGWTPTKLGSVAWEVSERAGDKAPEILSVTKHAGFVPSLEYFGKQVFSKDTGDYKLVKRGQFAYATIHLDEGSIDSLRIRDAGAISPMYTVFDVDSARVDRKYLLELLKSPGMLHRYSAIGLGSVNRRRSIGFDTLAAESILLPPLPEQKKIAAILSSVDDAIRATQAVLDQTRQVKEGLLQELLTRGIGPDGKPHTRFKQTEIGEVPEGWEVLCIEALLAAVEPSMRSGPFGSALLKEELVEGGIPFLGIDNVHVERFVPEYRRFITQDKFEELKRYAVRPGDVMITIMGTVGRSCVVPDDIGSAVSSKHTWTLTFDATRYRPYLACAQVNYAPWVKRHFERDQQGGTMAAIRSETLRSLRLPVPPADEQATIEAVLRSVDDEAGRSEECLRRLKSTKSSLLSDLLTGRVRVTP